MNKYILKILIIALSLSVLLTFLSADAININTNYTSAALKQLNALPSENPISFQEKAIKITTGTKKGVKIISVNPKDPSIRFEAGIPDTLLNKTKAFEQQVKEKKAFAAVNANLFESYSKIKDPIGHVFVDGKLIYGQSGLTTVGITYDKDIIFSKPATFVTGGADGMDTNIRNEDGSYAYYRWTAYEVNTLSQSAYNVIMYTPERGDSVDIAKNGYIVVVEEDTVVDRFFAYAPKNVKIPKNGFVIYFGEEEARALHGYDALQLYRKVHYKYTMFKNTNEDFQWDNMQWAISGGPDLVIDGELAPASKNPIFSGARFTTMSTPRTALGITDDGRLLLVSVPSATIKELKEIMKSIGSIQAVNLDGGASTAMFYDGKTIVKPGRELATILYIYKN